VWACSYFLHDRKLLTIAHHPIVFSTPVTYLPTAVFVEDIDKLFDSFNTVKRAAPGKTFCSPVSDNSPHIGHWTKASTGIKSWIFLKDGSPAFKKPTPSQNG
jgi:hypothetical protein